MKRKRIQRIEDRRLDHVCGIYGVNIIPVADINLKIQTREERERERDGARFAAVENERGSAGSELLEFISDRTYRYTGASQ